MAANGAREPTPLGAVSTKLHIPQPRPQLLHHRELVGALAREDFDVALIAAPAGAGKTTLLAAWHAAAEERRAFAWLSLDDDDNDPVRFWGGIVAALQTLHPEVGERAATALRARSVPLGDVSLPLLVGDLAALDAPVVLALDDYHLIVDDEVHASVRWLLDHLPGTLTLAVATRADPPLPLSRLRARGQLREIRGLDLRCSVEQAAALLNGVLGLSLAPGDVAALRERTEGWAAGLQLAGLSLRSHPDEAGFIAHFAGDDRLVVDYLGSEVLDGQPDGVRAFLRRTSVLERLSGPLCDAVTGEDGGAERLAALERENLFVVPLDARREWYRYHPLFAELLRRELERAEPELAGELHRRARDWLLARGAVPEAIHHALASPHARDAAGLVAEHWNAYFNQGRLRTVTAWLDRLPALAVEDRPELCVARAWLAIDDGGLVEAERWIEAAEAARGEDLHADVAVLRAVHRFKVGELAGAGNAARSALALAGPEPSFARTAASCVRGIARYWSGDPGGAATALGHTARLARATHNDLAAGYALGYLALIAAEAGALDEAEARARDATALSDEAGFAEHFVLTLAHLARGEVLRRRGDLAAAEAALEHAMRLSRRRAGRIEVAATLLALATLRHERGARDDALELVRKAAGIVSACADPGPLAARIARAERLLRRAPHRAPAEADALTDRELAVLRLLATELSQREIGGALYLSRNTVKTHVRVIYRKLGATQRAEAVHVARERDLI